jgi:hypothetical protein
MHRNPPPPCAPTPPTHLPPQVPKALQDAHDAFNLKEWVAAVVEATGGKVTEEGEEVGDLGGMGNGVGGKGDGGSGDEQEQGRRKHWALVGGELPEM